MKSIQKSSLKHSSCAYVVVLVLALLSTSCQKPAETPQPATGATPSPTASAGITPADIPQGFGYPGDRTQIQAWADAWQIDQITQHTWDMWAGMTANSGQTFNGGQLPYWETWCGTDEVFGGNCGQTTAATRARPGRPFRIASQLTHEARLKGSAATPGGARVVSFNKFNPAMAQYLQAPHKGPGGGSYNYTSVSSLISLNAAWPPNTPTVERKVEESPYTPTQSGTPGSAGIETKPVIFLVKATGLTPMPLWLGPANSSNQTNPTPDTWNTCVLLDPANTGGPDTAPVPATQQQIASKVASPSYGCTTYLYAPLSTIYNFKMDATDAAAWNQLQNNGGTAAAGDFGVLAGMHVNTKEIVNWTWQTFWWQAGQDTPNSFPGSKAGMTTNVKGPWRNYAMCTAYNQTQGKASTKMVVCFNPFLETSPGIPAGITSNCMSCHGTATAAGSGTKIQTLSYPTSYTRPISFGEGTVPIDPMFAGYTRTDFSWAIPVNSK